MSHIPSAAMPHAKPHELPATIATPTRDPLPWAALAAGGVLAIGGAITAALLLRGDRRKSVPARRTPAKSTRSRARTAKPRKAKTAANGGS